jgi:hypothetical protein
MLASAPIKVEIRSVPFSFFIVIAQPPDMLVNGNFIAAIMPCPGALFKHKAPHAYIHQ